MARGCRRRPAADVYREFERAFGERLNGVVVQSQVPAGLELSVGATAIRLSVRSSPSAPGESKPRFAQIVPCSSLRSRRPKPATLSRGSTSPHCSTASAAGPSCLSRRWSS